MIRIKIQFTDDDRVTTLQYGDTWYTLTKAGNDKNYVPPYSTSSFFEAGQNHLAAAEALKRKLDFDSTASQDADK